MSTTPTDTISVLVIDDDAVLRATVRADLEDAGFSVEEAHDGPSGLTAFTTHSPDIVLLDVSMPSMDGFTVCVKLRALPAGAFTPVMMLTGHDDSASVEQALKFGATDFAVKPINEAELVHRVRFLFRSAETAKELRRERASLQKAQQLARMGSWELDPLSKSFQTTPGFAHIMGWESTSTLTSKQAWEAIHSDDRTLVLESYKAALRENRSSYDVEFRLCNSGGDERHIHQYVEVEFDDDGSAVRVFGTLQDLTERRNAEARIESLANFDSTTGLPNRKLFFNQLRQAIAAADRHDRPLAVLLIDVGHLDRINKSRGHAVGDQVVQQLATRLNEHLRISDIVVQAGGATQKLARFSGEVFAVLLAEMHRPEHVARIARRIKQTLSEPVQVEDSELVLDAHIGISLYPTDGAGEQELLKNCTVALDIAKTDNRDGYAFYDGNDGTKALQRFDLEQDLYGALERKEFEVHYQPKVTASGDVAGMEALVRWRRADGLVSPAEFIPIAEETGLILPLGAWVLATACEQAQRWRCELMPELRLSVNLSAVQLEDEGLIDTVADTLTKTGLNPDALELELTESMLMTNVERNVAKLHSLRHLGIHLSIDDFGTGYSSLGYLKNLPITTLKIDRCFVQDIANSYEDLAIVRGIIALAHSLSLIVVAEGVEDVAQRDLLCQHGCDQIQGYYYNRPCAPDEFAHFLIKSKRLDQQSDAA